jgi:hypothetical protein
MSYELVIIIHKYIICMYSLYSLVTSYYTYLMIFLIDTCIVITLITIVNEYQRHTTHNNPGGDKIIGTQCKLFVTL